MATRQVLDILDAIQTEVMSAPPWADQIRAWKPSLGDRVRLARGQLATVVELPGEGVIVVEHETTGVRELIPADAREQTVVEIMEHAP